MLCFQTKYDGNTLMYILYILRIPYNVHKWYYTLTTLCNSEKYTLEEEEYNVPQYTPKFDKLVLISYC